jgi:rRNA-processing protein FCF1
MTAMRKDARPKLRIILDTNAFFVPTQFKIDIFEHLKELLNRKFEPILLTPIQQELENLAQKHHPRMLKNASMALELAQKCTVVTVRMRKGTSPDDIILRTARKWKLPVFTNDRQLRKKLRDINVPVVYVRQKSRLEIDGRL